MLNTTLAPTTRIVAIVADSPGAAAARDPLRPQAGELVRLGIHPAANVARTARAHACYRALADAPT